MKRLKEEIYFRWPSHLITAIIAFLVGAMVVWLITSNVIVKGHDYKVVHVFTAQPINDEMLESTPIEVGKTGGFLSLSFIVHSIEASFPLKISYRTSFDNVSWHQGINSENTIIDKEIHANRWYVKSLNIEPSAYLKILISLKGKASESKASIDMDMFHHM